MSQLSRRKRTNKSEWKRIWFRSVKNASQRAMKQIMKRFYDKKTKKQPSLQRGTKRMILTMGLYKVLCVFLSQLTLVVAMGGPRVASSDVYVVRVRGPPLSAYRGSDVLRFAPTAAINNERPDFTSQAAHEYADYLRGTHDNVLEEAIGRSRFEKLYSYTNVLNAFTVKLPFAIEQAKLLEAHPQVVSVEPDKLLQKTTTHTPDFLDLPHGAWPMVDGPENAGEGVVIGMLDTGIDPTHMSFSEEKLWSKPYPPLSRWKGECDIEETFPAGSCNGKVLSARYFAKGIMAADLFNKTYDFTSPLDGDGHGTHTSSTATGSKGVPVIVKGYNYGSASGVAPRARVAIYKVIFRDGGFLSDVLAGMDQAVHDGVDVLSISLGSISSASGVPCLNTFDVALLFAVSAGVVVVHAAGNSGPYPLTMNSYGPWLISVAAGLSDRSYDDRIILRTGEQYVGSGFSSGTPGHVWHHLIYSEDALNIDSQGLDAEFFSYCQNPAPFNATLVKNKILMCDFVEFSAGGAATEFQRAVETATSLNAAGLVVLNKATLLNLNLKRITLDPIPFTLPAVFIADSDAATDILNFYYSRLKKDAQGNIIEFKARALLNDSRKATFTLEAPQVASYSSRGPVYANTFTSVIADILKPDLVAPGNQIWGAWTPNAIDVSGFAGENFAMISGTSMATPHIAGIVALIKQKHPEWSVSAIHSALSTTANTMDAWNKPILAEQPSAGFSSTTSGPASPFDIGSGAVNATSAMDPGLVFERGFQDYVDFLCTLPGVDSNTVQDATGATCDPAFGARSSDLNMPSITTANLVGKRVVRRTVTNVSKMEEYSVSITAPYGVDVTVHPSKFRIRPRSSVTITITLQATVSNGAFTFGSLVWEGDRGHVVKIPLSVSADEVV